METHTFRVHTVIHTNTICTQIHAVKAKLTDMEPKIHTSCCVKHTDLSCAIILSIRCTTGSSEEDAKTLDDIKEKIKTRPNAFFEMEAFLPKKNG